MCLSSAIMLIYIVIILQCVAEGLRRRLVHWVLVSMMKSISLAVACHRRWFSLHHFVVRVLWSRPQSISSSSSISRGWWRSSSSRWMWTTRHWLSTAMAAMHSPRFFLLQFLNSTSVVYSFFTLGYSVCYCTLYDVFTYFIVLCMCYLPISKWCNACMYKPRKRQTGYGRQR